MSWQGGGTVLPGCELYGASRPMGKGSTIRPNGSTSMRTVILPPFRIFRTIDLLTGPVYGTEKRKENLRGYFAAVSAMDEQVGRLLDALEEKHLTGILS